MHAKLTWAFILMSCVPIGVLLFVAAGFAFPYTRELFPLLARLLVDPRTDPTGASWWLWAVIALTVVVATLGTVYLTMKIIEPVLQVSQEVKRLAENPSGEGVVTMQEGELGDLTNAVNQLTARIRTNMAELNQVGERTSQINLEIQKRMVILASLLQIGECIGSGKDLEAVLDLIVERLGSSEGPHAFSALCLQPHEVLRVTLRRAHQLDTKRLAQVVFDASSVRIDADHPPTEASKVLWEALGRPNLVMQPVMLRSHVIGVLAIGNHRPSHVFTPELIELVSVFAKQTSIALENELLLSKNRALAIKDELTGQYNETYMRGRLEEEIKRAIACQRPCAIALFTIDGFEGFQRQHEAFEVEQALKNVAKVIQETITDIDRVGRFNTQEFVVVLPERNKRQAIDVADEIRRRIAFAFASSEDPAEQLTVSGSVAENPIDGMTAEELLSKARAAIHEAASRSHNAVVA